MPPIITCAAALNPCFNVHGVELLIEDISTNLEFFDDSHATKAKKWLNDSLVGLYNLYYTKYGSPTTQSTTRGSSSRASGENQIYNLLHRLKEHKSKKAMSDSAISSEYERYIHEDFITHLQTNDFAGFDVVGFWKSKESMFLVLSRMAMDVLSVQATSVAFESAILTSGRVLSIRRTKLTPSSLEMCALDFEEEILTMEVQDNEATPLSDEEITLDAASQGTMASGSGGEEPDFDYGLMNYDIDD
ncbi:zinc finger BED domain-containing protein RICESLEEPER 2-like protein [Tanacetum coccineum]